MVRRIILLCIFLLIFTIITSCLIFVKPDKYNYCGEYLDYLKKSPISKGSNVIFDSNGIPTVKIGGKYVYNPVTISQYGLQEYSYYIKTNDDKHFKIAQNVADWLVNNQDKVNGKWYYDFDFNVGGMGVKLKAPWASAMAQGQAISLLSRVYYKTHDKKYLDVANKALLPLIQRVEDGGLTAYFHGYPYYEEYPTNPPSYTLNGFMFTLIGLYDLSRVDPKSDAKRLYKKGYETLIYVLPYYEMGKISAYHLGHMTNPPRAVHISESYHKIHITLLDALNSVKPNKTLQHYRDLWQSYIAD
jgi:heparosan-N-sulfate-glucuronate 5-epimerase